MTFKKIRGLKRFALSLVLGGAAMAYLAGCLESQPLYGVLRCSSDTDCVGADTGHYKCINNECRWVGTDGWQGRF
ncbi:MAG: hypothetical protein WC889_12930 [Myxococcota bacterium]|jgi:hypothetical protein